MDIIGIFSERNATIFAAAVSFIALLVSVISFRQTRIEGNMPVCILEFSRKHGWILRNVGNGSAINLIISVSNGQEWTSPVRLPGLMPGESCILKWINAKSINVKKIGLTYNSTINKKFSTVCSDDVNKVYRKNGNVRVGKNTILPEWQEPDGVEPFHG